MLKGTETRRTRARRPPPSLKQQYHEYVLQRIETYKNSLGRNRLLEIGGEAATEMQDAFSGQFLLTEVLMQEAVDRLISKRLRLPTFNKWKQQYSQRRRAQREPTHWGLEPDCALAALLPRIESEDVVLVAGAGAAPAAYLLAAHDALVTFIAADLGSVERMESGLAGEALASTAECFFVQPGCWLPPFPSALDLMVLDASSLGDVESADRAIFIRQLQGATGPGGVHLILPGKGGMAPEAVIAWYDGWPRDEFTRSRRRGAARPSKGVVLTKPDSPDGAEAGAEA
jgi:hypothetical protein